MSDRSAQLIDRLGLQTPIFQAPMAGVSTPQMAAAVTNAGGLGAIGIGAANVEVAQAMIAKIRAATDGPFNVNVFCHRPAVPSPEREAEWLARMAPLFARFGAEPPRDLREIYTSFAADGAMQDMLCAQRPDVVSFHFGLPDQGVIERMKSLGIVLLATATSLPEAQRIAERGIDGIVAQGWQAGGHRGVFDPDAQDERLATLDLVRQSVDGCAGDRRRWHHDRRRYCRGIERGRCCSPAWHGIHRLFGKQCRRWLSRGSAQRWRRN